MVFLLRVGDARWRPLGVGPRLEVGLRLDESRVLSRSVGHVSMFDAMKPTDGR